MIVRRAAALALAAALVAGCSGPPQGVDTGAGSDAPAARTVEYTVRPGDDLARISESFFGDASRAARIAADNDLPPGTEPHAGSRVRVRVLEEELRLVREIAEARGPYNSGVDLMGEGEDAAAEAAFREALQKAPHMVDARYNLGLVLLRQQEFGPARAQLLEVAARRPDDPDAHYALGASYFHEARYAEALGPLGRALELDPGMLRARFSHALCLTRMGRNQEARAAWLAYLEADDRSAWAQEARDHLRQLP